MGWMLRVTTVPDKIEVPEDWLGAVSRNGKLPVVMEAREWLPGDEVDSRITVAGRTVPVRFTVGSVEVVP